MSYLAAAECRDRLRPGAAHARPGPGDPLWRHHCLVPGARRRLVESQRGGRQMNRWGIGAAHEFGRHSSPAAPSGRATTDPTRRANAGYAPAPLPQTSASAPIHGGEAQRLVSGQDIRFEWWQLFKSTGAQRAGRARVQGQSDHHGGAGGAGSSARAGLRAAGLLLSDGRRELQLSTHENRRQLHGR